MREDLIFGIHAIFRLIETKPQQFLELYVAGSDNPRLNEIALLAKSQGITIHHINKKQLDIWLPNLNHQGIAAKIRPQPLLDEHDLMEIIKNDPKTPFILILDTIQDPHNLGACLRTADATGVTAVIVPKDKSASLTPIVRKIACGAAETVSIVQVTNLVRCIESLKKQGIWIIGTSGNAKSSIYQMDLKGPVAIVLGAEGTGLRRLTEEHCDLLMQIPMVGTVESLNVSVATAVCLYEALRQRLK